jgi:predicted heme/steroid binding protein
MPDELREFSREELAKFNGENGQPVYIAHGDRVYDVSESKLWKTGSHMRRHLRIA